MFGISGGTRRPLPPGHASNNRWYQWRPAPVLSPIQRPWCANAPDSWCRSRASDPILPALGNDQRAIRATPGLPAAIQPLERRRRLAPRKIRDFASLGERDYLGDDSSVISDPNFSVPGCLTNDPTRPVVKLSNADRSHVSHRVTPEVNCPLSRNFPSILLLLCWRFRRRLGRAIFNHSRLFQCHQSAFHHFIDHRQELVDFFLAVHNFDDHRQVE
jgi:hypothetical protein